MERFTAYVTKYALTTGIYAVDAELRSDISPKMISYKRGGYVAEQAFGNEWHRTPEAAIARAEEMRIAKIDSLRKQIARLAAMQFEVPK